VPLVSCDLEVKDATNELNQSPCLHRSSLFGARFTSGRLQGRDGSVQYLIDDALGHGLDSHFLLRTQSSQSTAHLIDLRLTDVLEVILERDDHRHNVEAIHPFLEAEHFSFDDQLGTLRFRATGSTVTSNHRLQV